MNTKRISSLELIKIRNSFGWLPADRIYIDTIKRSFAKLPTNLVEEMRCQTHLIYFRC